MHDDAVIAFKSFLYYWPFVMKEISVFLPEQAIE